MARNPDGGIESPVMTDRKRHRVRRGRIEEGTAGRKRIGDRLFHQHRQAVLRARDADLGVVVVRRGDDSAVERLAGEQLPVVAVEARAVTLGDLGRRGQGIRDRYNRALGLLGRELEVTLPDTAGTEQRQSKRIAHADSPPVPLRMVAGAGRASALHP